ncbi:MAG: tRNA pseudouridine(38-40) synthase TruA [Phycisphaerales bacterium]|nr:tRNA pseudouridine(38-40) synthase TruA [Phycisphaerales bacterium]MCI0630378.1 tRNA pseudouridine(38-40) synthase TruA [Phycisphaerales bacterium]MCI0676636.1 tRNA pseudouridine(38-40) synthase TruA [Phycisphaerales bacterium]
MPRYKLTVAYDGTDFHGWQKQQRTDADSSEESATVDERPGMAMPGRCGSADDLSSPPALRTVQGTLEKAVRRVVGHEVNVLGASRTDAGVHARGQVAAFSSNVEIPVDRLARAITSRLPDDVQVTHAEMVHDEFDPISDAIAKGYRYRIAHGCARGIKPLFDRHFVTRLAQRLDPELMNEAARMLLGEHDFASFARISHGRESTVRTIYECKVMATSKRRCHIDVAGNGFLYNMVRIIAGTLVEIGRGRMEPAKIKEILAARDRNAAGPTMPPTGLCLMWVRYAKQENGDTVTPARRA